MNFPLERNLLIAGGLASELNLRIAMDRRRCEFHFGQYHAPVTMGNCAPRVTCSM